ncbi:MAG: adenine deaminase [Tissierellia bacterium]|nr:adenine deaminase [Tissierellia bacterium]
MISLNKKISIANGIVKAEKVFKNGVIANVFTGEFIKADIAVEEDYIIAIGQYEGKEEIDLEGKIICPTLIDGHVHIESSMVSPAEFTRAVLPRGIATVIADPHEIANVKGKEGIDYMLEATEGLPLKVYFMMPSCVPATDFETSGARLNSSDLLEYKGRERVLGLGEMMNFPGVIYQDEDVINKIKAFSNEKIDGHGPMLSGRDLNAYIAAGITTDHECSTLEEMRERLRLGMYVQMREGTGAKNLRALIKGLNKDNMSRCFFCTDDRHPESLLSEGSIDNNIRIAISEGVEPIDAIKLGSFNAASAYNLKGIGAIAPNYKANFIVLNELESFDVDSVYIEGVLTAKDGEIISDIRETSIEKVSNTVNIPSIDISDLKMNPKKNKGKLFAIGVVPESLITEKILVKDPIIDEDLIYDNGFNKLVVINRHTGDKNIGISAIAGFGKINGAIASTIAHDSHNIIVVGNNDEDILKAIQTIEEIEGGLAVVRGEFVEKLPLEIAGIMSSQDIRYVDKKIQNMKEISFNMGVNKEIDPFMTLSFMALPVIPSIKLTDRGLFDVEEFKFMEEI